MLKQILRFSQISSNLILKYRIILRYGLFFNISPFLMTYLLTDHSQKVSKNQGFMT